MKCPLLHRTAPGRASIQAFTLAEALIAMGVFSMVVAAMVATQIFGLRVYTLAATKLSATASSRKALNSLRDQVREAKLVDIGNCDGTGPASFVSLGLTNVQVGKALRLSSTNNWTNSYTVFYLDTNLVTTNYPKQCRVTVAADSTTYGTPVILASYITNGELG